MAPALLQCRELFKGGNRRDTIFDKIFKGALDEFGREMKTVIGVEMQVSAVVQTLACRCTVLQRDGSPEETTALFS